MLCAAREARAVDSTSSVSSGSGSSAFDSQAATSTSAPGCGSDDGGVERTLH